MTPTEKLEAELKELRDAKEQDHKIKYLKKQIRAEKFAQTKGGKVFNTIGDAGIKVAKQITAPPKPTKHKPTKKAKAKKPLSVSQVMENMEKSIMGGGF